VASLRGFAPVARWAGGARLARRVAAALVALGASGCAPAAPASDARVWSSASSNDGFAACPSNTSVVGGGFEVTEGAVGPGRTLRVVASKPQGNGWQVDCVDDRGVLVAGCKAWAVCATVLQ
jgi:hypothetical protein